MVGPAKADNVFGQVMICLRMSKLDYLVNETPYSAYVTIRKKFLKSVDHEVIDEGHVDKSNTLDNQKQLENENCALKRKVKDLESACNKLKFEYEEIEVKYEDLEKENNSLEDKLANLHTYLDKQKVFEEKYKMSIKEAEENVLMLENVVATRDLEISKLNKEMKTFEATKSFKNSTTCGYCDNKSENETSLKMHDKNDHFQPEEIKASTSSRSNKFKCDECELLYDDEQSMRLHVKKTHEIKCETCNEIFAGQKKLKNHMCRVHLKEPDYLDIYMRNWYRRGDCLPVFSKKLKKELIILHSENCWESENFCSDIPENVDTSIKSVLDENDVIHTAGIKSTAIRKDGSICWLEILSLLKTHLPNYSNFPQM